MMVTEEQEYVLDQYYDAFISKKTAIFRLLNLNMSIRDICEGIEINEEKYWQLIKEANK